MTAIKHTRINNALLYADLLYCTVNDDFIYQPEKIYCLHVIKSKQEFDARLIDIELAFLFDSMSMINRTPPFTSAKNNDLLDRHISIS